MSDSMKFVERTSFVFDTAIEPLKAKDLGYLSSAPSSPRGKEPESELDPARAGIDETADESDAVSVDHCSTAEPLDRNDEASNAVGQSTLAKCPVGRRPVFAELVKQHYSICREPEEYYIGETNEEGEELDVREDEEADEKETPTFLTPSTGSCAAAFALGVSSPPSVRRITKGCVSKEKLPMLFQGFVADEMHSCLRELRATPACEPFLALPWHDPALGYLLEKVADPMDLSVVGDRLEQGQYEATTGEMKPEAFWADVDKCWEGCTKYHAGEDESEPNRMAEEMCAVAEVVSDRFWTSLIALDPDLTDLTDTEVSPRQDPDADADRLLQGWTQEQLRRCLRALRTHPRARPFLQPFPWEDLDLHDYVEVVGEPIDLSQIAQRLDEGAYWCFDNGDENEGAWVDAAAFWADCARCWQQCLLYFGTDEEPESIESCRLARLFRACCEELEAQFLREVDGCRASPTRPSQSPSESLALEVDVPAKTGGKSTSPVPTCVDCAAGTDFFLGVMTGGPRTSSTGVSDASPPSQPVWAALPLPWAAFAPADSGSCDVASADHSRDHAPWRDGGTGGSTMNSGRSSPSDDCSVQNFGCGAFGSMVKACDGSVEAERNLLDQDAIIHPWCQRKLRLCLQTVADSEFLSPEDLRLVRERLENDLYNDEDGLIDPEPFWDDVRRYIDRSRADVANVFSTVRALEDRFHAALVRVEQMMHETEVDLTVVR
eukprot:TRINITY_DN68158_c0_g1_i1.p1 TRINITY_DN68158_c0_g1~~TRINITY_DN68158_c0_g1_i1.p1  ORF type:complete len:720 (-),score=139.47 TRINITY_DN68158_c0_g1_i1:184-2343(-)